MYSQFGEDDFIGGYFKGRVGRFLDIGAWQPKTISNTRRLFELGWDGVLVEPSPEPLSQLVTEYGKTPSRVSVVGCAISTKTEFVRFWDAGKVGLSTMIESFTKQWVEKHKVVYQNFWVSSVTMDDFVRAFPGPYHFVSIDAEGISASIFLSYDWSKTSTEMVVIEHDDRIPEILTHAAKFGMKEKLRTFANVVVAK